MTIVATEYRKDTRRLFRGRVHAQKTSRRVKYTSRKRKLNLV